MTVRGTGGEHTASDTIIVRVLGPGENPTLTLTVAGPSGRGVITLMPAQTACQTGEQCTYMYPVNTVVTLQATPYEGFSFGGWTGCDIAEGPFCSVTMNGNRAGDSTDQLRIVRVAHAGRTNPWPLPPGAGGVSVA